MLTVRVAGPSAVLLQHETEQFIARVNSFLGYNAVTQLRIVQRPIESESRVKKSEPPALTEDEKQAVAAAVADVESDGLRAALDAAWHGDCRRKPREGVNVPPLTVATIPLSNPRLLGQTADGDATF